MSAVLPASISHLTWGPNCVAVPRSAGCFLFPRDVCCAVAAPRGALALLVLTLTLILRRRLRVRPLGSCRSRA
jgi:hypothetical protein